MSRNQRIALLLAAVAVAVVAVVVATSSGGDDSEPAGLTETTAQTETTATETTAEPAETRIEIEGGKVVGGPADIKVKKGDHVSIVVSADAPDDIHLHGYDIEKPVEPGKPARFDFTADIEGIFEIESHVAEDAGRDPLLGKLTVEPS
jgi:plastocyanin